MQTGAPGLLTSLPPTALQELVILRNHQLLREGTLVPLLSVPAIQGISTLMFEGDERLAEYFTNILKSRSIVSFVPHSRG
jgi:hypothetical protein